MNVHFEIAKIKDAGKLTKISVEAFHTDFFIAGRRSIGGPPGYDSIKFHEQMIRESTKFYKIMKDSTIIGGFWFNSINAEEAYLYRIFVEPKFHRKGVGSKSFDYLFHNFQNYKWWSLKVPIWNSRTPNFYKKIGFEVINKSDKFIFFRKKLDL